MGDHVEEQGQERSLSRGFSARIATTPLLAEQLR